MFSVEIIVINTTWHISHQTFVLMKTPWRCLSSSSSEDVFKTSWSWGIYSPYSYVFRWRLDQDQYIRLDHTSSRRLQEVFKTSWKKRLQNIFKTSPRCFKMFSRLLHDIFKTFSKRLQERRPAKASSRHLRRFEDVFKTSSRRLAKMSSIRFQEVLSS